MDPQESKKLSGLECTYEQYLIKEQREQNELSAKHTLDKEDRQNSSDSSSEGNSFNVNTESDEAAVPIIIAGQEQSIDSLKTQSLCDSSDFIEKGNITDSVVDSKTDLPTKTSISNTSSIPKVPIANPMSDAKFPTNKSIIIHKTDIKDVYKVTK